MKTLLLLICVFSSFNVYSKDYESFEECVENSGGSIDQTSDIFNEAIIDKCQNYFDKIEKQQNHTYKKQQIAICISSVEDQAEDELKFCRFNINSKNHLATSIDACNKKKRDFITEKSIECREINK